MTAGRKPKPNAIKKLSGSKHYNPNEPQLPGAFDLTPPRGRLTKEAREFWKKYAPMLAQYGVLKETDLPTWELCCLSYGLAIQAYKEICNDGLTAVDQNGAKRKHPLWQVFRDATTQYTKLAALFGLDPANRGRLKIDDGETDELERFFMGRYERVED